MNHYYPVFCVASRILQQERYADLDETWQKAHSLYQDFLSSEFNDLSRSELDCIHAFMDEVYSSTPPTSISVGVYYYIDEETGKPVFDTDSMTNEFETKLNQLL